MGCGDGRGDRDLAAELVGRPGLAFADALDLRGVQRIDLGPALALLLVADLDAPRSSSGPKRSSSAGIAVDLAADVADDAAEPGAQEFELAPGALELVGMGIAPDHDGGALGHPQIALAQRRRLALGQADQLLDRPVDEPGVGRMRDRLLLHGGVHHDPLEILGLDRLRSVRDRKALLQERRELLLAQPLAPARQRRAVERRARAGTPLAAEVLEIRVLHPALAQRLVASRLCMCLRMNRPATSRVGNGGCRRPAATDRAEAPVEEPPVDLPRQPHQRMAKVDDRLQRRPKQVVLTIVARFRHLDLPSPN